MNHIHFPIDIGRAESLLEQNAVLGFGEVRKHPSAGGAPPGDSLILEMSQGTHLGLLWECISVGAWDAGSRVV